MRNDIMICKYIALKIQILLNCMKNITWNQILKQF